MNLIRIFFVAVTLVLCSCKDQRKERLYDKMASEFCELSEKDSSFGINRNYEGRMDTIINSNLNDLTALGFDIKDPKQNSGITTAVLSESRMKKYCPQFLAELKKYFQLQKEVSKIKHGFKGSFVQQEKIANNNYLITLENQKKDSLYNFFSKDSIKRSLLSQKNVSVIYHKIGSHNFVDSVFYQ